MKATLEFNLPDEREEFETASDAAKWRGVAEQLDAQLRNLVKYEDHPAHFVQGVSWARTVLRDILLNEGLGV